MVVLDRDDAPEISGPSEGGDQQDQHAQRTQRGPGKNIDPPHRREPAVVEAHQPIDCAERQAQGKKREAGERDPAVEDRVARRGVLVLQDRVCAEPSRRHRKKEKVKCSAEPKKPGGEIRPFLEQERVPRVFRKHPIPELRPHKNERHKEQSHHREQAGEVLQLAADDDAPLRIHRMMDEDPEERARADREEKHEREKVGERELLRIKRGPDKDGGVGGKRGDD